MESNHTSLLPMHVFKSVQQENGETQRISVNLVLLAVQVAMQAIYCLVHLVKMMEEEITTTK